MSPSREMVMKSVCQPRGSEQTFAQRLAPSGRPRLPRFSRVGGPAVAKQASRLFGLFGPAASLTLLGIVLCLEAPRAQAAAPASQVDQVQRQVVDFVSKLADLHCTEDVLQEKLRPNGGAEVSARSQFDYFLYIQGNSYDFQLSESRLEIGNPKQKKEPLLLTNGFSTLLLVFHPYYRNGFEFTVGPKEALDARPVIPVHFAHIAGTRTPVAMAMRGREFPLDLKGTAWVDASTGQVIRMEASLAHDLSDVGLRALTVRVDYTPSLRVSDKFMLPSRAVVDLETPRQHWRNTHIFHNYKLFSTDATQDPDVKVRVKDAEQDPNATPPATSPNIKEQP
jgi:hypothetical protein